MEAIRARLCFPTVKRIKTAHQAKDLKADRGLSGLRLNILWRQSAIDLMFTLIITKPKMLLSGGDRVLIDEDRIYLPSG
jgi:hypothetical protein